MLMLVVVVDDVLLGGVICLPMRFGHRRRLTPLASGSVQLNLLG